MIRIRHEPDLRRAIAEGLRPITGARSDYDPLLERVGEARVVLLGEASHGTHEFYRERAEITKRLIVEKGFNAVAVEADWPDAYRVNRFVRGAGADPDADAALGGFRRFPTWMWRNTVVRDFVAWLREHNAGLADDAARTGFYGLDLYSLHASMEAVVGYLESVDPAAARRARFRYSCFEHFGEDPQAYGYAATFGIDRNCEDEVVAQLRELRRRTATTADGDARLAADELFYAQQNARLARNAEEYYRSMFGSSVASWNLRDSHMAGTLDELLAHLERTTGRPARAVVWEHNSHLGDARATEMGDRGEHNVGQLARERFGDDCVNVGFTTFDGTVTAAHDWGDAPHRMRVRPGLDGSFEALFHEVGTPDFYLDLHPGRAAAERLRPPRLERAIGVIYRPRTERLSHYFEARLADQFDAVIHLDRTRALQPLEPGERWHAGEELPETFPTGV